LPVSWLQYYSLWPGKIIMKNTNRQKKNKKYFKFLQKEYSIWGKKKKEA